MRRENLEVIQQAAMLLDSLTCKKPLKHLAEINKPYYSCSNNIHYVLIRMHVIEFRRSHLQLPQCCRSCSPQILTKVALIQCRVNNNLPSSSRCFGNLHLEYVRKSSKSVRHFNPISGLQQLTLDTACSCPKSRYFDSE